MQAGARTDESTEQNRESGDRQSRSRSAAVRQGVKKVPSEKNGLFDKLCQDDWTPTCKSINLDPYLTPFTKINSEWMINLNVKTEVMKL